MTFDSTLETVKEVQKVEVIEKGSVIELRYEIGGEMKQLFTTPGLLIASALYVRENFFKSVLES